MLAWVACLIRNTHTSHCMCASVYMLHGQCQTCMTHHINIATCNKWADVQPSLNTSHGCMLHFPMNGNFRGMRKLRKSVHASEIVYMHTHTLGGRLVGGGGGVGGACTWVSSLAHLGDAACAHRWSCLCQGHCIHSWHRHYWRHGSSGFHALRDTCRGGAPLGDGARELTQDYATMPYVGAALPYRAYHAR